MGTEHETKRFTIGVDLSGAKIKVCALKDDRPEFIDLVKEEIDLYARESTYVATRVRSLVDDLLSRVGISQAECDAIGLATPGHAESGLIETRKRNSFAFLKDVLEQQYDLPVYFENDADMAALGEYAFGAGRGADNMVLLSLGNSVGAGLVLNGQLYRGGGRRSGEVGQMIIDEHGISDWYQCPICHNRGCADSMASETAVVVLAKDELRKGKNVGPYTFEDVAGVRADVVIKAAKTGDHAALEIVTKVVRNIAVVIYNTIITIDPDVLVVGGRLSRHFDFLFPLIERELGKRNLSSANEQTRVLPSQVPGDIGLLGILVAKKIPQGGQPVVNRTT